MLPCPRSDERLYPVPKFDLGRDDIVDFVHELRGFHEQFAECFQRSESREHFYDYMAGQFSELERKSIEPIALALKGGNVRSLQRFVSDAPWDDDKIMSKYRSLVNDDLGSPDGALIFDESGFVKTHIQRFFPGIWDSFSFQGPIVDLNLISPGLLPPCYGG